jgi:hypothetical protein
MSTAAPGVGHHLPGGPGGLIFEGDGERAVPPLALAACPQILAGLAARGLRGGRWAVRA